MSRRARVTPVLVFVLVAAACAQSMCRSHRRLRSSSDGEYTRTKTNVLKNKVRGQNNVIGTAPNLISNDDKSSGVTTNQNFTSTKNKGRIPNILLAGAYLLP